MSQADEKNAVVPPLHRRQMHLLREISRQERHPARHVRTSTKKGRRFWDLGKVCLPAFGAAHELVSPHTQLGVRGAVLCISPLRRRGVGAW